MHVTQNITKNIIELQEDSKKKNPELYRECEEVLMKIRQIDNILSNVNTEGNNESQETVSYTDQEISAYKEKRMTYQIRPFIKALATKKKVNPYVYDAISALMSKMVFDDAIVLELSDSLILQLNINRDHAIKIFQLFFFVIQYGCVKGDIIINLFYALINTLAVTNQGVIINAKAMSKQIVYVIFMRFKNAYIQFTQSHAVEEEYEAIKKDCKTILCDIYEFMDLKNENKLNIDLSLEFIEIIFKVEEIFHVTEIKEMFIRLVNKIDTISCIETDACFKEKHNKIILCVVKSCLFTEESTVFIEKSTENLYIFDAETIMHVYENIHNRNTFFNAAKNNILNENIGLSKKYKLVYNIFTFLRNCNKEEESTEMLDTTMEIFTLFFNDVPISQKEEDNIIEILIYLISHSLDNKERLYNLIQRMVELEGNCSIECFKLCCKIKSHLMNEWKILCDYINTKKDMNCFNYLLQQLHEFTPQELFYVLAFFQNPEHIRIIFKRTISIVTRDLSSVISVFCRVYKDSSLLCSVIDEYVMFLTEHDLESEILPFLFVDSCFRKYSIKEILNHHSPLLLFKDYNYRINALCNVNLISDKKIDLDEAEYKKLLVSVHNAISVLDNRINSSWVIIFDILQFSTENKNFSSENFKILQTISENFYPLLTDSCKIRMPGLFLKVSLHETENINIVLQILNLLGDNAKSMNKITVPFDLWKEYLINVIEIIKKSMIGWSDVFDTGLVILHNILEMQHLIDTEFTSLVNEITYDCILSEILVILKELFYSKITSCNDLQNDEKKRFKDTLILGLQRINLFLNNTQGDSSFIDDYYKFVSGIICYNGSEKGYDKWKDEIVNECLNLFKIRNSYFSKNYLFVLQRISIFVDDTKTLYYKIKTYSKLLEIEFYDLNQNSFMEHMERFFAIENLEIRNRIFELLITNCKGNTLLYFSTQWLKSEDKDILARLLSILKEYFIKIDKNIIAHLDNKIVDPELLNQPVLEIKENLGCKSKISFENQDCESKITTMKNLMKNLTVLINYDMFWDELLCVIQLIAINIRENLELVKYFMELAKFIFENTKSKNHEASDLVTMFGALNDNNTQKEPLSERRRERTLIELIEIYMSVVSGHFIDESGNVNDSFVELSFSLINDLSNIQSGFYRENLSGVCLSILFKYSRFTRNLLLKRVRLGLTEYVKQIAIYKDVYSRVKRNELFQILDGLIENPGLVKDLKNEVIDALSTKDFNAIEKIKICLKKGL